MESTEELRIPCDSLINQFSQQADIPSFPTRGSSQLLHQPLSSHFALSPSRNATVSSEAPLQESPPMMPRSLSILPLATSTVGGAAEEKITKNARDFDNSNNIFTVTSLEDLKEAASARWLLPTEILHVLTKWKDIGIKESTRPPKNPTNGDIFLFDKTRTKNFRDDGVKWVMKKGTAYQRVREDFVKFTATNGELVLTGFYTYSQEDTSFKRRCYKKSIEGCTQYFVHYRQYSEDENYRVRRKEKAKKASNKKIKASSARNTHNTNDVKSNYFDNICVCSLDQSSFTAQISNLDTFSIESSNKREFELQSVNGNDFEDNRDLDDDDLNSLLQGWSHDMCDSAQLENPNTVNYSHFSHSSPSECMGQSFNVLDVERKRQMQLASYVELVPTSATIRSNCKVLIVLNTPYSDFLPFQCKVYFTCEDFITYSIGGRINESVIKVKTPTMRNAGRYSIHIESLNGILIAPKHTDFFEFFAEEVKIPNEAALHEIGAGDVNTCLSYGLNSTIGSSNHIDIRLPSLFAENFPVSVNPFMPTLPDQDSILGKRVCDDEKQSKIRIVEKLGSVVSQHTGVFTRANFSTKSRNRADSFCVKSTPGTMDGEIDSVEWLDDRRLNGLSTIDLEEKSEKLIQAVMRDLVHIAADNDDLQSTFNSHDSLGFNILHYCCMYKLNNLITPLLEKGAFIDDKSSSGSGFTALHLACCVGNKEAVEILLSKGADIAVVDSNGQMAAQIASSLGYDDIYQLFGKKYSKDFDSKYDLSMDVGLPSHIGVVPTYSAPIIDIGSTRGFNPNKLLQKTFESLSIRDKCALSISFGHSKQILEKLSDDTEVKRQESSPISMQKVTNTDDLEIQSVLSDLSESDKGAFQSIIHLMGPQELENVKTEVKLIQNNVRGWLLRKNYVNLREAIKTLQIAWRERKKQFEVDSHDEDIEFKHESTSDLQFEDDHFSSFIDEKQDKNSEAQPSVVSSLFGNFNLLKIKPKTTTAVTAIQAATRGMLARKAFDDLNKKALSTLVFQRSVINHTENRMLHIDINDHMHDDEDNHIQ